MENEKGCYFVMQGSVQGVFGRDQEGSQPAINSDCDASVLGNIVIVAPNITRNNSAAETRPLPIPFRESLE